MADGKFIIDTRVNTSKAEKSISGLTSSLKRLGSVVASVFAIGAIINFGKQAIDLASDIEEVDNVVSKAFGNMRAEMDALAESAINTLGMSRLTAYKTGSTFMSMGKSMLDSEENAKNMAIALTKLTANMSSFYNVEQDVASTALKSIYTGETETLKQYGVVMSEVNLKEYALANGITKAYSEMTQSEKVMLRYKYVTEQLNYIGNDFVDTQNSWANQTRILKENWKEFMSVIGSTLISVLTPAIKMLNQVVVAMTNAVKSIQSALSSVFGIEIQKMSTSTVATEDATDAMLEYGDAIEETGKKASGVSSFDKLNNSSSKSNSSSSGGGSVGGLTIDESSVEEVKSQGSAIEKVFEKIKNAVSSINFKPIIDSFNNLSNAIMPLIDLIVDGLGWALKNVLYPLDEWLLEDFYPAWINLLATDIEIFVGILNELKPLLTMIWESVLKPIFAWLGQTAVMIINQINGILQNLWNSVLQPLMEWINTYILPILQPIIDGIMSLVMATFNNIKTVVEGLLNVLDGIITFVGGIFKGDITKALEGIKKVFSSILDSIGKIFNNTFTSIGKFIGSIFTTIGATISSAIELIKNVIKTGLGFILTVWRNSWTGVKTIVTDIFNGIWSVIKGIINAIIGGIEGMANGVVSGINLVIKALNHLSFKIPDWVPELGGKKLGFNLTELSKISIPRLATGAVLPANSPFLAVVGDQKQGTNVEAPLSTIKQALIEALNSNGGGYSQGDIVVNIDGKEVFRAVQKQSRIYSKSTGLNSFA